MALRAGDAAPGLTTAEVEERRHRDGPNEVPAAPPPGALRMLAAQLTHLLAILLWVAAGLALLAGMPALSIAIGVIVVLNAVFAFWQEHRADRSTQRLRDLLPQTARVVRNGRPTTVHPTDLVVGDLVLLEVGDRVGADLVVRVAAELGVDESLTTGESGAVRHGPGDALLAGTFVVQGHAEATVTATGAHTTLAGISALAEGAERPPSPLTLQLRRVVRLVAVVAAGTGVVLGTSALLLGLEATEAFLFGVGVSVALVPEGLLPTVTLSLARGAQVMAGRNALVRRLDAVETLGATTYVCTDKTGTLTQNRMAVVEVVTAAGTVHVAGRGYDPVATFSGPEAAMGLLRSVGQSAAACVTGRVVHRDDWVVDGDPMEAAVHCFALRTGAVHVESATPGAGVSAPGRAGVRRPFTADRMLASCLLDARVHVLGAPEVVLARCPHVDAVMHRHLAELTARGRRVLAVATRCWTGAAGESMEEGLELLGLLALEDPPRPDVAAALHACREAGIRVTMVTGDHPGTARALAREIGLQGPHGPVLSGPELPSDESELAALLDTDEGAVVARVSPADKLRIARALRSRGHVVAMTGDGVNDAPALREADVGVAMGASGSDVARECADLVLLDDNFGSMVGAIELGRATFSNVRRFLTFHLTDNVAELAPFAAWALSGGNYPLAIGVLQVLALDIGTDMLPALALGTEPPRPGIMRGRRARSVVDRALLVRAFGVLGATEALVSLAAFTWVLVAGGWSWGRAPDAVLLAQASGTAFATIAVCQMANALACRSTRLPAWRLDLRGNPSVLAAIAAEAVLLAAFLGLPGLAGLLGGTWPDAAHWALALGGAAVLVLVDGVTKAVAAPPGPARRSPAARPGRRRRGGPPAAGRSPDGR